MATIFKEMAERINFIITDLVYGIGAMSKGDFAVESSGEEKYVGQYKELFAASQDLAVNRSSFVSHRRHGRSGQQDLNRLPPELRPWHKGLRNRPHPYSNSRQP